MKHVVAVVLLTLLSGLAQAAETRCGWLENPSPANWWLNDRDGSWDLSTQGGYSLIGDPSWSNLPRLRDDEFVRTNGQYGYACACLTVTLDRAQQRVVKIHSGKQLLLKRCLEDRSLPAPAK